MTTRPILLVSLCFCAVARAQAPAPSYDASLKEGRAQLKAGQADQAVHAFQAAVAAKPNDAVALSELGWAQFVAKDYKHAEETTLKAIMRAGTNPKLKSADWYNMGRIQEA